MAHYALLQNGVITNVIVADSNFIQQNFPAAVVIDGITPPPGIGWSYAGGTFTPPAPPPTPPLNTIFSRFGFRSLFTVDELVKIDNFQSYVTDPAQLQMLTVITKNFDSAENIDTTDPATQAGVNYLVTAGLITSVRAAQILGA